MNSLIQWIHLILSIPMNSFILWTHGFTEFIYIQETSNDITVTDNGTEERHIFNTPKKKSESLQYKTPEQNYQEISRFKDTFRFLSPATKSLHDSIEKANKESELKYNARQLKEVRKNIIDTMDHILSNDLVQEYPSAAKYVAEIERKMQQIKEDFTKEVISIVGSKIGKNNELCFPSFQNKTKKQVQKRHKGISG